MSENNLEKINCVANTQSANAALYPSNASRPFWTNGVTTNATASSTNVSEHINTIWLKLSNDHHR